MDPTIKAEWVAALRSGNYTKGQEKLHPTDDSYCCLGVLCDIHKHNVWIDGLYEGEEFELPTDVADWADLGESDPSLDLDDSTRDNQVATLARINDYLNEPFTFAQIADLIAFFL